METAELRERLGEAVVEGEEAQAALRVLQETPWGVLAMAGQGWPYAVPINFACEGTTIYFHGGDFEGKGKKLKAGFLAAGPEVCLTVVSKPEMIESFPGHEDNPCYCGFRYESVLVFGKVRAIEDDAEQDRALRLIVGKYRPAMAAAPFDPEILGMTMAYCLEADAITYKTNATYE
jgi:nitroimidazol reductase NimA-like FMN-containing flavoprotein (pyridoxamine 5'-phosphate oxidase superfamily)